MLNVTCKQVTCLAMHKINDEGLIENPYLYVQYLKLCYPFLLWFLVACFLEDIQVYLALFIGVAF